jgi:hypothetical protein
MGYLVLDTNVLIDNLNVLRDFSEDLDRCAAALPISMRIIVPNAVLSELDGYVLLPGSAHFGVQSNLCATDSKREMACHGLRGQRRRCCCKRSKRGRHGRFKPMQRL